MAGQRALATRLRLMNAALALYAERGYAGTCLDAILERASSSKGAFYHHFSSKEDLTATALRHYWTVFLAELEAHWRDGLTPEDKLDRLLSYLMPGEQVECPLGLLGFESRSLPEQVQDALSEGFQQWLEQLSTMLQEAGITEPKQALALAQRLFLMYEGAVLVGRIGGDAPVKDALSVWRGSVLAFYKPSQQTDGLYPN